MTNNLPANRESQAIEVAFDDNKRELLRNTICKGSTPDEFELFLHACKRTGLDPFMKQIYAVKRWDSNLKRESMTIQTGIDGYRLIAERTGRYCPGQKPTYEYDNQGNIVSCTAYVKKQTKDGSWHEVSVEAFFEEYCQRNKEGKPIAMWAKMARTMLAKCAESLALRKAFPGDLSGIYTKEEMQQAEIVECKADLHEMHEPKEWISREDAQALELAIGDDEDYKRKIFDHYQVSAFDQIEKHHFRTIYNRTVKRYADRKKEQEKFFDVAAQEASVFEVTE